MNTFNRPALRRGFTLVELLVVVAIIALLAAILFPAFARVRENARRTTCLSNLKQFGMALIQYQQDNEGYFPMAQYNDCAPSSCTVAWRQTLYPYIKDPQIYVCPSNKYTGTDAATENYPAMPRDYALNANFGPSGASVQFGTLKDSAVISPSTRIYATENASSDFRTMFANWGPAPTYSNSLAGYMANSSFNGHLQTINCLFADGHAKAMQPINTGTPVNMWGYMDDSPSSCNANLAAQANCSVVSNNQLYELDQVAMSYANS